MGGQQAQMIESHDSAGQHSEVDSRIQSQRNLDLFIDFFSILEFSKIKLEAAS